MKALALVGIVSAAVAASAQTISKGTEVMLRFEDPVSSRTAKAGDTVRFTVRDDVRGDGGALMLHAGEHVTGVISAVDKHDRFGKNARIRLTLNPVHGIPLEPRDKGKMFSGGQTDKAAIASGAGALVFGPIGLVGGYFVTGKSVNVKVGDSLRTEVASTTRTG